MISSHLFHRQEDYDQVIKKLPKSIQLVRDSEGVQMAQPRLLSLHNAHICLFI